MNASAITPRWAAENATPVDLATIRVAVAVPGPQATRAAVPRNSAASLRESWTSAMGSPDARGPGSGTSLLSGDSGRWAGRPRSGLAFCFGAAQDIGDLVGDGVGVGSCGEHPDLAAADGTQTHDGQDAAGVGVSSTGDQ